MNLDQPLSDLKNKVDALDDMFDCPVCFERLSGNVPQCTQGHHLCLKCRAQVSQCPTCKRSFNGTRNYFVENMITKFEELKCSLTKLSVASKIIVIDNTKKTELSVIGQGKFPCGDSHCDRLLSYCDLIHHIKQAHNSDFIDVGPVMFNEYDNKWTLVHIPNSIVNKIIYIHNMGIFFIKIDISHRGNVYGHVEIANNTSNAQHFTYTLKMGDNKYAELFNGQVVSTGTNHNKSRYLSIHDLLWKSDNKNLFYCYLTITCIP